MKGHVWVTSELSLQGNPMGLERLCRSLGHVSGEGRVANVFDILWGAIHRDSKTKSKTKKRLQPLRKVTPSAIVSTTWVNKGPGTVDEEAPGRLVLYVRACTFTLYTQHTPTQSFPAPYRS